MNIVKTIIDKFKLKEVMAILFIASLVITCIPEKILLQLSLGEFKEKYQVYISMCLIITLGYYIYRVGNSLIRFILSKIFSEKRKAIQYMKNQMSGEEMVLLVNTFYDYSNNTFRTSGTIDYSSGTKTPLEHYGVIYLASNISHYNGEISSYGGVPFAYNLQPYAREFLNENLKNNKIKISNNNVEYKLK